VERNVSVGSSRAEKAAGEIEKRERWLEEKQGRS